MSVILGIDPGKKGAFFLLGNDGPICGTRFPLIIGRTITTKTVGPDGSPVKRKTKDILDWDKLLALFWEQYAIADTAVIERVAGSIGGAGQAGMFNFGESYGFLCGIVMAAGIPLHKVGSSVWKPALGLLKTDKEASRKLAASLLPSSTIRYDRVKDEGVAEAGLIAHYGRAFLGL